MADDAPSVTGSGIVPSDTDPDVIQRLLDELRQRWARGDRCPVETLLARTPGLEARPEGVVDLIYGEILLREEAGQTVDLTELLRRFPQYEAALRRQVALHQAIAEEAFATSMQQQATADGRSPDAADRGPTPDHYELLGELGRGGMSVVYRARQPGLKRVVALKMILAGAQAGPAERSRFRSEAEAVARLQHPNIVQVHEVGELDGKPFLCLEYVSGGSLAQKLQGGPLLPRPAAELVETLARAVEHAHGARIIHRDLKPANILLTADGIPKIADFGLAKQLEVDSGQTGSGTILGTPSYMAPEQAEGRLQEIGPRSDVYSLGAMLYETLTGRPPFRAATVLETLHLVRMQEPVPPRRLLPTLSRDLDTICLKCLEKEPSRRYATARELADDLRRFLDHQPIRARPVGNLERLRKWARRRPTVAALWVAVIFVALLGLAGVLMQWQRAEHAWRAEAEERQRVEQQLYLNRITLADRELAAGKIPWAEDQLALCPPALRNWEWHFLHRRCRGEAVPALPSRKGAVSRVAVSPDSSWIAASSSDRLIQVWDGQGKPAQTLAGHPGAVNWVAFAPDGQTLAGAGEGGEVILWDWQAGRPALTFRQHGGPVSCVEFHPAGQLLASATFGGEQPGLVLLWERNTGSVRHHLHGHASRITAVAFSPDGRLLASASHDQTVRIWDVATGQLTRVFAGHQWPVSCVVFSPDGQTLASAGGRFNAERPEDGEILLWAADTGQVRHRLRGHAGRAVTAAFLPGGARLATAGWDQDHGIKLWDPRTGQEVLTLMGHQDAIMGLVFGSDHRLYSGCVDGGVRIWNGRE